MYERELPDSIKNICNGILDAHLGLVRAGILSWKELVGYCTRAVMECSAVGGRFSEEVPNYLRERLVSTFRCED